MTLRIVPALAGFLGLAAPKNGTKAESTETVLLLREIRTAVEKIATNTEGQQTFIHDARAYFIDGRRAINRIDQSEL